MTAKTPSIDHFSWTGDDEDSFMLAAYAVFNGANIPEWNVVLENGTSPGQEAFTIEQNGGGWQINFRRDTGDANGLIRVSVDPLGNFTDPGDNTTAPTLTSSAEWSGETTDALQMSYGGSWTDGFIWAVDDCVCIAVYDITNSYWRAMMWAGKPFEPATLTDSNNYLDGFQITGYRPVLSTAGSTGAIYSSSVGATSRRTRIAQGTWVTDGPVAVPGARGFAAISAAWDMNGQMSSQTPTSVDVHSGNVANGYRPFGRLKYVFNAPVTAAPKTRLDDSGGAVRYMYFSDSAGVTTQIMLWNDTETPLP